MAKKAKKTASWRTLARRAKKAGSPTVARRMRAKSAALRRADRATKRKKVGNRTIKSLAREAHKAGLAVQISAIPKAAVRAAKGWATRRANQMVTAMRDDRGASGLASMARDTPEGINRTDNPSWQAHNQSMALQASTAPGHGEIVGGVDSQLAEKLVALARKKGGKDAVQIEIMALRQAANYEGRVETDKAATNQLIEVQQILADRVVCGFIAEIDTAVAQHHGLPPAMTFNLSAFLVVKIIDALNKAGYRATGKS